MKLEVQNLCFQYEEKGLKLNDISLSVTPGSFIGIIGPNGSGKSTLLKNIYRALKPQDGVILLDNENIEKMSYKTTSQSMAVVGQENETHFHFTVNEVVKMGRTPYKKLFELDTVEDDRRVEDALKKVGMLEYSQKDFNELSGGEKQRVMLARALCQNGKILILDEPTNHLDIYYQLQIFDLIKELHLTVIAAIHDLNIACLYCDELYVLKDGKIFGKGKPEDIMTHKFIYDTFHVKADVKIHPYTQKLHITFLPYSFKGDRNL